MSRGNLALLFLVLALLVLGITALWLGESTEQESGPSGPRQPPGVSADQLGDASRAAEDARAADAAPAGSRGVIDPTDGGAPTGVRGRVLDVRTLEPLAGVQVRALREPPSLERLITRFRGAFLDGGGFFAANHRPPQVLGAATTAPDGSFELLGLRPGSVFLDARSDFTFVRAPARVRLAAGEVRDGVELLASPGGRIRGRVLDAEGLPASGSVVSVRPGLNAFLGQITQRKYRWLEAVTDADGDYDIPGVPEGFGYSVSAAGPLLALEEVHRVGVREGQVTRVDIQGHRGAFIAGRVVDPDGAPVEGAHVAMVYLDVSRILFSADGRSEPVVTDAEGQFALCRVATGRVAFVAAADGLAPSGIEERAVVDDGVYDDLELVLRDGATIAGLVVDDAGRPVPDARVELRPVERPGDPDVLKMALKVRTVSTRSGDDGRFVAAGLTGERLVVQVEKTGYVTELRFGVRLDEELQIELTRGVTVRGRVVTVDGERPVERFAVDTRSRRGGEGDAGGDTESGAGGDAQAGAERGRRGGFGGGRRGGFRERGMREGGMQLAEGRRIGDRGFGGRWEEFREPDGRFELRGLPPGRVRVRVRAEGLRNPDAQEVALQPGEQSDELVFRLEPGAVARGRVIDGDTGEPVSEARVTAYRSGSDAEEGGGRRRGGGGVFRVRFDPEDMDFLGLAGGGGRGGRTATTDSTGAFEIVGLTDGDYRFTARHPDRAKASAKDVTISAAASTDDIVIELGRGGGIEGRVTGAGRRPLADALIVALSISAGSFKSSSTDAEGDYRIDGLPPGQYVVFKSRMDERSTNLGYDLMGNMRLKNVTVRHGRTARLDIHDESENGVRVYGTVRDGGQPVARAMVTAIGADREGLFGMGLRAKPTDEQGRYELIGLEPGDYYFQITRFRGRPEQANLSIEVPEGLHEFRADLDLPTSSVAGQVVDTSGNPVAGIQVSAGVEEGGIEDAPGLLGIILRNGVAQARTDESGRFELQRMAAGTYRITASGRGGGGRRLSAEASRYGAAALDGVRVDGTVPIDGLVLVLPMAGTIRGRVLDGSGNPVAGAELHYSREGVGGGAAPRDGSEQLMDLFGVQARPATSGSDGAFEITGVTPGTYRVRADADGLSPGVADDVLVVEGGAADVSITVVTGATVRVRARNVDGTQIPLAHVSLLDGQGKPLASRVSVLSVFRRLMGDQDKKDDTGWYELGKVPPDTYTVVIEEPGEPVVRFTREIKDGETVEWDIDLAAELEARK